MEQLYDKLRKAGVIDCTLNFGCKIKCKKSIVRFLRMDKGKYLGNVVTCLRKNNKIVGITGFDKHNILGHDLSYGRTCGWIEEKEIEFKKENSGYMVKTKLDNLRHCKDLPLQQQENEMEILTFINSLIG